MATHTQFKPLMKGKYDPTSHQAINDFLNEVWDYGDEVYTFLCTQDRNGGSWREHAIQGGRSSCITQLLEAYSPRKFDWYFCPNSFAEPKRQRSCALPTHYAWADIDDAEPARFMPQPTTLWKTSPGRFQGLWRSNRLLSIREAEGASKRLWKEFGGDCAWSITKVLRVPGTLNHKPSYETPRVKLIRSLAGGVSLEKYVSEVPATAVRRDSEIRFDGVSARDALKRYRHKIGCEVSQLIIGKKAMRPDRSKRIFQIVTALAAAHASLNEIAAVLWENPYFLSKWGKDEAALHAEIDRILSRDGED